MPKDHTNYLTLGSTPLIRTYVVVRRSTNGQAFNLKFHGAAAASSLHAATERHNARHEDRSYVPEGAVCMDQRSSKFRKRLLRREITKRVCVLIYADTHHESIFRVMPRTWNSPHRVAWRGVYAPMKPGAILLRTKVRPWPFE